MQAHPLSVLRGGRVAQASTALHYCAKAALHSVWYTGVHSTQAAHSEPASDSSRQANSQVHISLQ